MTATSRADLSLATSSSMSAKFTDGRAREFFWGCELSTDKPEVKWSWDEEDDDKEYLEHTLFLRHAILGADADVDERCIVEVETKDYQGKEIKHPICSIGKGAHMVSLDLNYSYEYPVIFRLAKGKGPVHLVAQQLIEFPEEEADPAYDTEGEYTATETEDLEDEDDDDEDEEEEDKEPKGKGQKRKAPAQEGKKKKGKLDMEEEEDEEEDEEEEEEEDEDMEAEDEEEDESEEDPETPEKKKKSKAKGKAEPAAKQAKKSKEVAAAKGKGKKEKTASKKKGK